jgi:hypothetical protein
VTARLRHAPTIADRIAQEGTSLAVRLRFRDRLAEPKAGYAGLFDLQMKFFSETNVPLSIVEYVRSSAEEFTR